MSKLSEWWKSWNSPKDVARQAVKFLRNKADVIAAWADRQTALPEPFESYDGPMVKKTILWLATLIERWLE